MHYRNDLLKAKKAAKDYKIEDLCNGAKLSPMTVTKILAGKENVDMRSLNKLAEFLEISHSDLFSDKPVEQVV